MTRSVCVYLCLLLASLAGCGSSPSERSPSGSPPSILSTSLKDGLKGEVYSQPLAASGGTAPLSWSLPEVPPELLWVSIDTASGALSGTPAEGLRPGKAFAVEVKDHDGRTDRKTFTLAVDECREGDDGRTFECHYSGGSACLLGVRTCSGGVLGPCTGDAPSTSSDYCGESCLACGSNADACRDGQCACGTAGPCDPKTPDCCTGQKGSVCTDVRGTDARHCGACGASCADGSENVVPTCVGGACVHPAPCKPGFARCPVGSNDKSCATNTVIDKDNCGGCGNQCPTSPRNAASLGCQDGRCAVQCTGGAQNCDANVYSGCECVPPADGSMGCAGTACAPQCPAGRRLCGSACVPLVDACADCNNRCVAPTGGSRACVNGACVQSCPSGWVNCNGTCVQCQAPEPLCRLGTITVPDCPHNVCIEGNSCGWGNNTNSRCGLLAPNQKLGPSLPGGGTLFSCNGAYRLDMQGDGNLVTYHSSDMQAVWSSGTWVSSGGESSYAIMQGDGNFVIYRNESAVWSSNTAGHPGAYLVQQDNGNLVVWGPDIKPLWMSHQCLWPATDCACGSCPAGQRCQLVCQQSGGCALRCVK